MAFIDLFKKKNPVTPDIPTSDSNDVPVQEILPTEPIPVPDPILNRPFDMPLPPKQEYQLTFQDAYTGKALTDTFSSDCWLNTIVHRLEQENILSFPRQYISIPGVSSLQRRGAWFPSVKDIEGIYSGMTLTVDVKQAQDPTLCRYPNFRKEYPLVFYRMADNVCVQRIDFPCYGYELPSDIVTRMQISGLISGDYNMEYTVLYWPCVKGMSTVDRSEKTQPLHLCMFDPEPGRIFILQEYMNPNAFPPALMYGCPTAAMPEHENILNQQCVDILDIT